MDQTDPDIEFAIKVVTASDLHGDACYGSNTLRAAGRLLRDELTALKAKHAKLVEAVLVHRDEATMDNQLLAEKAAKRMWALAESEGE